MRLHTLIILALLLQFESVCSGKPPAAGVDTLLEKAYALPCHHTNKLTLLRQALHLTNTEGDATKQALVMLNIGDFYLNCLNKADSALNYYTAMAGNGNVKKDIRSMLYAAQAQVHDQFARYAEALGAYEQSLLYCLSTRDKVPVWGNMGGVYLKLGNYDRALSCYTNMQKELYRELTTGKENARLDSLTYCGVLVNCADIWMQLGRTDKSKDNLLQAAALNSMLKDESVASHLLKGSARLSYVKGDMESALTKYRSSLKITETNGVAEDRVFVYGGIAEVFMKMHKNDSAQLYLREAVALAEKEDMQASLPGLFTAFGSLKAALHDQDSAAYYLQSSISLSNATGMLDQEKGAWEAAFGIYRQFGRYKEALDAYHNFITLRDSVYSISKASEITRLDLQAQFERQQVVDSLNQALRYEGKMQRQNIVTGAITIGLLLVGVLLFVIYRGYRIQKKYNALLKQEKERHVAHIKAQTNVLTDLTFVQSHEIRGPVSTILGLTQLYDHDDPQADVNKEVIEGITEVAQRLDKVITEVVGKENEVNASNPLKKGT